MNRRPLTLFAAAAVLTITAFAHAKLARTGDAQVQFTASGPAGMSIVGTTNELQVNETDNEVVIVVPLKSLDTKIDLRNKHMREKYLEVDKYPNAELHVEKSAIQRTGAPSQATGQLTIHGKTKATPFNYTAKQDGNVAGTLHVNIKDFGITQPGYAGVTVKPDIDVNVTFRVNDR